MKEKIFNLFLYINSNNIISEIGVATHDLTGSDKEKMTFLQKAVSSDSKNNVKFPPPSNFTVVMNEKTIPGTTYDTYMQMCEIGKGILLFEDIFQHYKAPENPLMCVTPVVNGVIKIDAIGAV
ncbi:MAG: hypothetical protein EPN85_00730 [Bacteroidetes bacterium]|nr:MAG: hypothetical protein EPN85_00730 [Bacteroidota bacterium]